jgi:hypothetical protein
MLRNPVDRAYSQYHMIKIVTGRQPAYGQSHYLKTTFDHVIEEELQEIKKSGITHQSSYLEFEEKLLKTRPKDHSYHSLLIRGIYAYQLMPYLEKWPKEQFKIMSIKDISGQPEQVQQVMNGVFDFMKLPPMNGLNMAPRNTGGKYNPMNETLRQRLEEFFKPYNQKLFELLGKEIIW